MSLERPPHQQLLLAPLLGFRGTPLQSSKFLIALAVIETPLGTLLVPAARSPLLRRAHDRRAWIGTVPPTTAAAAAQNQANAATRAASLDTELEHWKTNSEKLAAERASTVLR